MELDELLRNDWILAIVPLATALVPVLLSRRKRHAIEWRTEVKDAFAAIVRGIPGRIRERIMLDGLPIEDLVQYVFVVRNTGSEAIDGASISKPLTWTGDGQIRAAWVEKTRPTDSVDVRLCVSRNVLTVSWHLFNQGCMAKIVVLCERGEELGVGTIKGQIKNVPRIRRRIVSIKKNTIRALLYVLLAFTVYVLVFVLFGINRQIEFIDNPVPFALAFYIAFYASLCGMVMYMLRVGKWISDRMFG